MLVYLEFDQLLSLAMFLITILGNFIILDQPFTQNDYILTDAFDAVSRNRS